MKQRHGNAGSGCPNRMAQSNGAAVYVGNVSAKPKHFFTGNLSGGEGFIQFNELDVF